MKIIIDTNALMAIAEFKIDIFRELEKLCDFKYNLFIISGTLKELEKIKKEQREKYKRFAKLALALIKFKKVGIIHTGGNVDERLIEYSRQGDLIVTQDLELKKKLTKPYLTIRQKKKVRVVC